MPRNLADFNNVRVSIKGHESVSDALDAGGPWTIEAHLGDKRVGYLEGQNEIKGIWVNPEHRRKGIGSAMYRLAQRLGIHHSTLRTDEGEAWAASTSDYFPRWLKIDNYIDTENNDQTQ